MFDLTITDGLGYRSSVRPTRCAKHAVKEDVRSCSSSEHVAFANTRKMIVEFFCFHSKCKHPWKLAT